VDRWVDRLTVDRQTVDRSVDRWVTRLMVDRWVDRLAVDRQTVDRSVDRLTVDRQTVERWVFDPQTPEGRQFGTGASCSRQLTGAGRASAQSAPALELTQPDRAEKLSYNEYRQIQGAYRQH
jgi:hypothetical protein